MSAGSVVHRPTIDRRERPERPETGPVPLFLPGRAHQLGAFTTEQARDDGWTQAALRHAARTGRTDRLWRGAYARPVTDDPAGRAHRLGQCAVAGALTNPGALVSHLGAAALHDWPWWAPRPQPCITLISGAVTAVPGVHVHRAEVDPADRWHADAMLLTSPARTVVDVAREFGVEAGIVVGDAALRRRAVDRVTLDRAVRMATGCRGVGLARIAVPLLDGRSESVLESRSRYRMHAAGIPAPWTQVRIRTLRGKPVARVDFYWPEFGVVGEADGTLKYAEVEDVVLEKEREDLLRGLGLGFVRWGWRGLDPFDATERRLWHAFDDAVTMPRPRRWVATRDECGP